jgi:diaminopimelate decarboxylase
MLSADFEPVEALKNAWGVIKRSAAAANATELIQNITLLLEPGRSIIADAGICLTSVRNIKNRPLSEINKELNEHNAAHREYEGGQAGFGITSIQRSFVDKSIDKETWLLMDAGFNLLLSMATYNWYYHLISAERPGEEHSYPYKLAGPLCDGGDVYFDIEGQSRLPEHRPLPSNVKLGEVLALLNCGAYSLAQASQYNARFLPPVVLIRESGEPELVRKRDTFADLTTNEIY